MQTVAFLEMLGLPYNLERAAGASNGRQAAAAGAALKLHPEATLPCSSMLLVVPSSSNAAGVFVGSLSRTPFTNLICKIVAG